MKALMATCRDRLTSEQGLTILELVVGTMLLFVLTFGIINLGDEGTSLATNSLKNADINQTWRETMDTMTRQIRVAYYFNEASGTNLSFVSYAKGDNAKYYVAFQLNGSVLQTSVVLMGSGALPAKSWSTMAQGVGSLSFAYYDASGLPLTAPVNTMLIARVDISLSIVSFYVMTVGTSSEGHRLENETKTLKAEGIESVTIRNILKDTP